MLGDSDEIDLTDPLRDVGADTGLWLDLGAVTIEPPAAELPGPAFPAYPRFDFTPGSRIGGPDPTEPREPLLDLSPDSGSWHPAPDVYRFLLLLFAAAAVVVAAYFFGKT